MKIKPLLPLFLLLLAGCAQLGLEPAQTFEDRLAYAVSQNAAVRIASARSLDAGDITADDMQSVMKINDEVRTILDAAKVAAGAGDLSSAESRLALATALLVKLQDHLREGKK